MSLLTVMKGSGIQRKVNVCNRVTYNAQGTAKSSS